MVTIVLEGIWRERSLFHKRALSSSHVMKTSQNPLEAKKAKMKHSFQAISLH